MRMGIGLGIGINRSNYAQGIFGAYQSRVIADGGVTEAGACVDAVSGLLLTASLLLIPSGYKSGKAYAEIPTNGNGDLTWTRASTALRTNSSGLLESMGSGVPRLSYMYGSCPALLLEPQRTNSILRSEEFDNVVWTKTACSVTANSTISPDGTQNADTLTGNGTSSTHSVFQSASLTSGANYTISVYAKKNTNNFLQIYGFSTGYGVNSWANFDLNNGVVGSVGSSASATITNVGNGWYRCTISIVAVSTATDAFVLNLITSATSSRGENSTLSTSVFLWGCQFEQGAYPTTYIPTTSSSATRVADAYSRSLSSIASGTAYINITDNVALGSVGTHLYGPFSITGASLGLHLSRPNNQRLRLWTQASANVFQTTVTNLKLAITWDGTNVNVYQNGVKVVTNYAYALTNVNNLFSSTSLESSATISEIVLFNSVLTDAECISLTS